VANHRLSVFEISIAEPGGTATDLSVELPSDWARICNHVNVEFYNADTFGWRLAVVGDGEQILSFPWHDRANEILRDSPSRFPIAGEQPWDGMDQGWWASVIPWNDHVYIAETDFDELCSVTTNDVRLIRPGLVRFGDVDVAWHCVASADYQSAWDKAISICRNGGPATTE
jgi:hypothetical protein